MVVMITTNECFRLYFLVLLAIFIFQQISESKAIRRKRSPQAAFGFISSYYTNSKFDPSQFTSFHKYRVRLYSKASDAHLRILGRRRIDSLGKMNSADSILIIETVAFGVVRIRGESSGLYLCMNKRGHLMARKTLKSSRCAFIVEDDHPLAYKRYVSLAHSSYRIAFNKNGRPRTATRVPSGHHRSVLFVERRLTSQPANFSMRTRRHGHRNSFMKDPCGNANKLLLSKDWLKFWRQYCSKRKLRARKSAVR